jgi:hypothetical protein
VDGRGPLTARGAAQVTLLQTDALSPVVTTSVQASYPFMVLDAVDGTLFAWSTDFTLATTFYAINTSTFATASFSTTNAPYNTAVLVRGSSFPTYFLAISGSSPWTGRRPARSRAARAAADTRRRQTSPRRPFRRGAWPPRRCRARPSTTSGRPSQGQAARGTRGRAPGG